MEKISTFMCITNPEARGDLYMEAIESHLPFSDEFIVVDGGSTDGSLAKIKEKFGDAVRIEYFEWKQGKGNWTWEQFARSWNFGVSQCSHDWVCATEADHIFHEKDSALVRERIEQYKDQAVLFVDKLVSSTWNKWQSKAKFPLFINRAVAKDYGYGYSTNKDTDIAYPIHIKVKENEYGVPEGIAFEKSEGHNMGLFMYNYDKAFKTKEMILTERESANYAWNNSILVKKGKQTKWGETNIIPDLLNRMTERYKNSPYNYDNINQHPLVMHSKLINIKKEHLAYDLWESVENRIPIKLHIGCGNVKKVGFTNIDINKTEATDLVLDVRDGLPYETNSVDLIETHHFMEHLTVDEAIGLLNEMHRVLKETGEVYIEVPSIDNPKAYQLTHKSFWNEETFYQLTNETFPKFYNINNWHIHKLVKNERGDIHAWIKPKYE
jgi:glycosyltransferase involved in cell wall biosynthesis